MRARGNEKGGSTISNIIWLAVLAAFGFASWNLVPVYYDHYTLSDRLLEFTRLHPSVHKNDSIMQKIMREVREMRLEPYIYPQNVKITTREGSRQIVLTYSREATVLPGFKHTFHQEINVDQPFY